MFSIGEESLRERLKTHEYSFCTRVIVSSTFVEIMGGLPTDGIRRK